MAIETGRNGLTLDRFLAYIRAECDCRGYNYLPVTTDVSLQRLRDGRIREFSFRVATPAELSTFTPEQVAMKAGIESMARVRIATNVNVKFSLEAGDEDMSPSKVSRFVRWLQREKAADRGGVKNLRAQIIEANGDRVPLELLDSVHLTSSSELDLPDDDPDRSYIVRRAFLQQAFADHKTTLTAQFG